MKEREELITLGIVALIVNIICIINGTNVALHTILAIVIFGILSWQIIDFIETKKEVEELNRRLKNYKNGGKRK